MVASSAYCRNQATRFILVLMSGIVEDGEANNNNILEPASSVYSTIICSRFVIIIIVDITLSIEFYYI